MQYFKMHKRNTSVTTTSLNLYVGEKASTPAAFTRESEILNAIFNWAQNAAPKEQLMLYGAYPQFCRIVERSLSLGHIQADVKAEIQPTNDWKFTVTKK